MEDEYCTPTSILEKFGLSDQESRVPVDIMVMNYGTAEAIALLISLPRTSTYKRSVRGKDFVTSSKGRLTIIQLVPLKKER